MSSSLPDDCAEEGGSMDQWPISSCSSTTTTNVSLVTSDFETALERYLDETKPDPMARRQAESLVLEWIPNHSQEEESMDPPPHREERHHAIRGTLRMTGEYMTASIEAYCRWCDSPVQEEKEEIMDTTTNATNNVTTTSPKTILVHRRLHFELRVSASFVPLSKYRGSKQTKAETANGGGDATSSEQLTQNNNKGQAKKIRAAMIKRLTADSYIQKLLLTSSRSKQQQQQQETPPLLCEAHIDETMTVTVTNNKDKEADNNNMALNLNNHSNKEQQKSLEERVHVSEDMLEALRRCIWSHNTTPTNNQNNTGPPQEDTSSGDDVLSILEWVLAMPYLPRKKDAMAAAAAADGPSQTCYSTTKTTSLADRAYLRLLEDALWDECEKEGDNDLLNDLNLSTTDNDSSDGEEERNNNTKRRRKAGSS